MAPPDFTLADVDAQPPLNASGYVYANLNWYDELKNKFGRDSAKFLATHVGFEDNELEWRGERPLGRGGFGLVGLYVGRNKEGRDVKVSWEAIQRFSADPSRKWL
jgi:hypothetical protein